MAFNLANRVENWAKFHSNENGRDVLPAENKQTDGWERHVCSMSGQCSDV